MLVHFRHPGNIGAMELGHLSTVCFALAVLHTFLTGKFRAWAHVYAAQSAPERVLHLLGEVEVVFGLWAGIFLCLGAFVAGRAPIVEYVDSLHFAEPIFVFCIMVIASTRPVLRAAGSLISGIARMLPLERSASFYFTILSVGSLLGSLITEPAAMTVSALLLRDHFFTTEKTRTFRYLTLAVLFVNISVGGLLTSFAAPPVLMVSGVWGWDSRFMLQTFGWKAVLIVLANAVLATAYLRKQISSAETPLSKHTPGGVVLLHLAFLALTVVFSHHPAFCLGVFLFFLGVATILEKHHDGLKLRQSLLVAFFLSGLVVFGKLQEWWVAPLLASLSDRAVFVGVSLLTAVTDNAALTYLGAQVVSPTPTFQYALVAGAVTGGGLTVIANAPNPAGYSILQDRFGKAGIEPGPLLLAALVPTCLAFGVFLCL